MSQHSVGAILSAISGRMCVKNFGEVHACMEAMAGGPVWTHQLPAIARQLRSAMVAAFPDLAAWDTSGLNRDTAETWIAEREHLLSEMREVPKLGDAPASPFDHLPDGKPVIVAVVP